MPFVMLVVMAVLCQSPCQLLGKCVSVVIASRVSVALSPKGCRYNEVVKGFIVKEITYHVSRITASFTEHVLLICNVRHQWQSVHIPARRRQIDSSGSSLQWVGGS